MFIKRFCGESVKKLIKNSAWLKHFWNIFWNIWQDMIIWRLKTWSLDELYRPEFQLEIRILLY